MWRRIKGLLDQLGKKLLNIFNKKKPSFQITWDNGTAMDDEDLALLKQMNVEAVYLNPDLSTDQIKDLEFFFNIPKQVWPKAIEVPTLIVSVFSAQKFDAVGVDVSLLEEKGIAHYFCMSTKTMQEQMDEFRSRHPDYEEWEEESEGASVVVNVAILLEWPVGEWEWLG